MNDKSFLAILMVLILPAVAARADTFVDNFDSFNTSVWTFVDPFEDSSVTTSGGQLVIDIPAGVSHDPWKSGNNAPRVLQAIENTDFTIEAKFDSDVTQKYQMQGLIAQQSDRTYLRYDVFSDGSNIWLFAATLNEDNVTSSQIDKDISEPPYYLRIQRSGDQWTLLYSANGTDWNTFTTFDWPITIADVGIYCANHGTGSDIPAHTARVDYFSNTAAPGQHNTAPEITATQLTTHTNSATLTVQTDKLTTARAPFGTTTNYEFGTVTSNQLKTDHTLTFTDLTPDTTYHYRIEVSDDAGNEQITSDKTFITKPAAPSQPFVSDDFTGEQLDTSIWTITDPLNDASFTQQNNRLAIRIPAGKSHTPPTQSGQVAAQLVMHLKLDDSPSDGITDSSGFDNHGFKPSVPRRPQLVTGIAGNAYDFDGSDDYFVVPNASSLDLSQLTLSVWIYLHSYNNDQRIISKEFGRQKPYSIYSLLMDSDNETKLQLRLGIDNDRKTLTSDADIPLKQWTHIAATYDGARAVLYINGRPEKSANFSAPIQHNENPVYIGASQFYSPRFFEGLMDDIRIYNAALSAEQILIISSLQEPDLSGDVINLAPRLTQPIPDSDLEIQAKFDSKPTLAYQHQGLIVEQDSQNFLTFETYSNGSETGIFAAAFEKSAVCVLTDTAINLQPPFYLHILRENNRWRFFYSDDGDQWTNAADFILPLAVTAAGPYAGNQAFDGDAPEFTAYVDYIQTFNSPQISNTEIAVTPTLATLFWQTDVSTIGIVQLGQTTGYELGQVQETSYSKNHEIPLTVSPNKTYHTRITCWDTDDNQAVSPDITFSTGSVWRDDFEDSKLDTNIWTVIDPMADADISVNGGQLSIYIPSDVSHDITPTQIRAPHIMQNVCDCDFQLETKFNSVPSQRFQMQGLLAMQDTGNYIRFDIHSTGSDIRIYTECVINSSRIHSHNNTLPNGVPRYISVNRTGNNWSYFYSYDGTNWNVASQLQCSLNIQQVGIYAANHNSNSDAPEYTGLVEYLTNTIQPIPNQPGQGEEYILTINTIGSGSVSLTPNQQTYQQGQQVQLTAIPASGYEFKGWNGDLTGTQNPVVITITENLNITAIFEQSLNSNEIKLWYGNYQRFGHIGQPQRWANILGNLENSSQFSSLKYSINDGAEFPLTIGPDNPRLENPGDFNVEIACCDLEPGLNQLKIIATKKTGQKVTQIVTLDITLNKTWPASYSIDWSRVSNIQDVAQVVDGKWQITSNGIRCIEEGYDRLIAIGDMDWDDYEVTVPVTLHQSYHDPDQTGTRPAFGILMRWTGHFSWNSSEQPNVGWYPMGAIGWFRWGTGDTGTYFLIGNEYTKLDADSSPGVPQVGATYIYKMRVETVSGRGKYSFKVWRQGQSEPSSWLLSATESTSAPQKGSFLLVAHHVDATFGNVTVKPL